MEVDNRISRPSLSGPVDVVVDLLYGEHGVFGDVHSFKVLEGRVHEFSEPEFAITVYAASAYPWVYLFHFFPGVVWVVLCYRTGNFPGLFS